MKHFNIRKKLMMKLQRSPRHRMRPGINGNYSAGWSIVFLRPPVIC